MLLSGGKQTNGNRAQQPVNHKQPSEQLSFSNGCHAGIGKPWITQIIGLSSAFRRRRRISTKKNG
jgi:hypothetical protein